MRKTSEKSWILVYVVLFMGGQQQKYFLKIMRTKGEYVQKKNNQNDNIWLTDLLANTERCISRL